MKCKICGQELKLKKDKRYMVRKTEYNLFSHETTCYECVDCEECGCQNILNIREEDNTSKRKEKYEQEMEKEQS